MTVEAIELEAMLADGPPLRSAHYACGLCWPRGEPAEAICGATIRNETPPPGVHMCAKCLALGDVSPLPCGHP